MANGIYTEWIKVQNSKLYGWDQGTTVKAMLADAASTYVFNPDHTTVNQILTAAQPFVELSATGYSRPIVTGKTVYHDPDTDTAQFRCDNLTFGAVESGKTVKGVLLYIRVGGSDNANNDIPVAYIDTATGFPLTTGGGQVVLAVPVSGLLKAYYFA